MLRPRGSKVKVILVVQAPGTAASIPVCVLSFRGRTLCNCARQLYISPGNCVEKQSDGFHKCRPCKDADIDTEKGWRSSSVLRANSLYSLWKIVWVWWLDDCFRHYKLLDPNDAHACCSSYRIRPEELNYNTCKCTIFTASSCRGKSNQSAIPNKAVTCQCHVHCSCDTIASVCIAPFQSE